MGPPRVLGGQREAGGVLLRARVRLHAGGLCRAGNRSPRPRVVRPPAGRDPLRADERALARPRDHELHRRARRRRPGHRAHGAGCGRRRTSTRSSAARAASPSRTSARTSTAVSSCATIATYGEVVHTFVARSDYDGPFLPGYQSLATNGAPGAGFGLLALDHVVGNVELGKMNEWVEFYERVLGFENIIHFTEENITTEYSALMSKVMADGERKIKFPINEPAEGRRKSQIQEYLDYNDGPGVQHVAMQTSDIVAHRRDAPRPRRAPAEDARGVLRGPARPRRRDRAGLRRPGAARHPRRPGRGRLPAADLHQERAGPADAVLRSDRAPRRARASARATSRRCSRRSSASRPSAGICRGDPWVARAGRSPAPLTPSGPTPRRSGRSAPRQQSARMRARARPAPPLRRSDPV